MNKTTTTVVTILAVIGGLSALFIIYELLDDFDNDNDQEFVLPQVEGILLVADGDRFNSTNPDIRLPANATEDLIMFNKDSDEHDFVVNDLNVKSQILNEGENFKTTLVANKSGAYEYHCSLHPDVMRGKIIVGA